MTRPMPIWHLEPASPSSRVLVFQAGRVLYPGVTLESALLSPERAAELAGYAVESPAESPAPLLVARWRDQDIYAVELPDPDPGAETEADAEALSSRSLRQILTDEPADFAALCSTAVQLLHWQRDHRFCGRCASPTRMLETERARYCDQCRHRFFPRLSPCVIIAIRKGDQVLLAQSHRAAGQFYSLIAGFVEPGESAEEAVHREVAEETGLQVSNLRYRESQSWAFPHQLMLGYLADYQSGELVLETAELAAADWFSAESLPAVPGEWTIAGKLIRQALEAST